MIRFAQRLAVVMAAALLLAALVGAAPATAKGLGWTHRDSHACGKAAAGEARCTAIARSFFHDGKAFHAGTRSALATAAAADLVGYVNGSTIRTAYGITAQGDPSRVVAIVDAYDNPNAYANLTRFRSDAGLPAIPSCTLADLTALHELGDQPVLHQGQPERRHLPAEGGQRLVARERPRHPGRLRRVPDVQHPVARGDARSSMANLGAAVTTASNTAHVLAISNSYGVGGDYPATLAPAYDNAALKGIAVMASSG